MLDLQHLDTHTHHIKKVLKELGIKPLKKHIISIARAFQKDGLQCHEDEREEEDRIYADNIAKAVSKAIDEKEKARLKMLQMFKDQLITITIDPMIYPEGEELVTDDEMMSFDLMVEEFRDYVFDDNLLSTLFVKFLKNKGKIKDLRGMEYWHARFETIHYAKKDNNPTEE